MGLSKAISMVLPTCFRLCYNDAMRYLVLFVLSLSLVACGGVSPTATPVALASVPLISELLADPPPGPVHSFAYLVRGPDGPFLAERLGPEGPLSETTGQLWLETLPPLPEDTPFAQSGTLRYTLVELWGQLEGPASYGPEGRYAYRLVEAQLVPRSAPEVHMPLLLSNSRLYENQPVRLVAQLLRTPDSALLVEQLGPGGVPEAGALQIKLVPSPYDPALSAALAGTPDGRISFGPVEVVGLWRAGRLAPLLVRPQ